MGGTKEGHDGRETKKIKPGMRSRVIHINFYERGVM